MSEFYARDGQFWLDGQPQLIQAGEFHYFRTPPDQWRHRLGLLQAAGFNTLATYIPWLWHQMEEGVSDLDGHTNPLRDLAGFLDLAAEMGFLIIARPGPYIMAETINEGIPNWVFSRYPQVTFISQDQKPQNIVSYLHHDFLACVTKWYQAVFEVLTPRQVTHGGRIIMVQLDNEIGMPQWVRNIFDINPDTLQRFAAYLHAAYGEQLASRYPAQNLADFLRAGLVSPDPASSAQIVEDYRRFYRGYIQAYMAFLWSQARDCGMDVPPVVNIHGFMNGGKTFPIGQSQLIDAMQMPGMLSATDVYPMFVGEGNYHQLLLVNETTKAVQNPQQALFSIEFQAGGNNDFSGGQTSFYELHTRLCLSTGMRAINHYLFTDGENDPLLSPVKRHDWGHPVRKDGTTRAHYPRYAKLSRVLAAYGPALTLAQPQTVAALGFQLDDFMTEINSPFTQQATNHITHQREVILCDFLAKGLAVTHRPFRMVELARGELNPAQTPVCWVMLERQCDASTQQKLVDYVRAGGRLALMGRMCVEDFQHNPCTILQSALGVSQVSGGQPYEQKLIQVFQSREIPASFVETYTGDFGEVIARDADGQTVGFVQNLGQGQALLLGAALAANTLDDLAVFEQMAARLGCDPLFKLSQWADVRLSQGPQGSFLFINNYQDDPLETRIEHAGAALFGGSPVSLPARSGLILPLEWQVRPGVLLHYATAEIIEVSEQDGDLILKTQPAEFCAEMTLTGWICEQAQPAAQGRVLLQSNDGRIVLRKGG